jgi:hypothetical protein
MGQSPAKITRQIEETKSDIGATVAALQISAAATANDVTKSVALSIDDLGNKAGDATASFAAKQPKLGDPTPLLVASAIVGFVAGFLAPMSEFERKRLGPVGAEVVTRFKAAREDLLGKGADAVKRATDGLGR